MAEISKTKKRPISADWFVQGILTKIGDTFDRLTGRGWKPSSSLATSELAERLKSLIDAEARESEEKRRFVPHNIKLKIQWDKFSSDSEESLKRLEAELLTALIDHINDRRYYTYAQISLTVKPDYFTNGVKLFASFDKADKNDREASLDVTVPRLKVDLPEGAADVERTRVKMRTAFRYVVAGNATEKILEMETGERFSVGRTKENDLDLDDPSVSKMHASLLLNNDGNLVIADTGSTNGTFLDGERIAYGKAIVFSPSQKLRFGTVNVEFEVLERDQIHDADSENSLGTDSDESYKVGEFEFASKSSEPEVSEPAPTLPGIPMPKSAILKPLAGGSQEIVNSNSLKEVDEEAAPEK